MAVRLGLCVCDKAASRCAARPTAILDAYYERDSSANKRQAPIDKGSSPSDSQTIYYDDVVVATQRIGCRR